MVVFFSSSPFTIVNHNPIPAIKYTFSVEVSTTELAFVSLT